MNKRKEFDILDYIPIGKENAVTRQYLCCKTGLTDRDVRHEIHEARKRVPVLNMQDGVGYFIPDLTREEERNFLQTWVLQEEARLKSTGGILKAARKTLKGYSI